MPNFIQQIEEQLKEEKKKRDAKTQAFETLRNRLVNLLSSMGFDVSPDGGDKCNLLGIIKWFTVRDKGFFLTHDPAGLPLVVAELGERPILELGRTFDIASMSDEELEKIIANGMRERVTEILKKELKL